MKKVLLLLIVLVLAAGLISCSSAIEDAVNSQIAEEESASASQSEEDTTVTEDDIDINISEDGGSISVEGEEGSLNVQEGGMPWPSDKLPSSVPEVPGVTVVMVMDMDEAGILIGFENCDQSTADAYIANLKSSGWNSDMEMNAEDGYSGFFTKGSETLIFGFTSEDSTGSLTYTTE